MERLLLGIRQTQLATEDEDPKTIVDNYEDGLNANMCNALTDIFIKGELPEMAMSFNFDESLPLSPSVAEYARGELLLQRKSVDIWQEASRILTPDDEKRKIQTITGTVTEVRSKYLSDNEIDKSVRIKNELKNQPDFNVLMNSWLCQELCALFILSPCFTMLIC